MAEEGAEIITDGESAVIATEPTLVNMRGGETVYTSNETEKILSSEGLKPFAPQSIDKNQKNIDSLLSGKELDLKSIAYKEGVLKETTPMGIYSLLEKYQNWITPESAIMSRLNLPSQDFSKLGVVNNNQKETVVQFNGDIHVHEVQNVDSLSKAIVQQLPRKMTQALSRRDL